MVSSYGFSNADWKPDLIEGTQVWSQQAVERIAILSLLREMGTTVVPIVKAELGEQKRPPAFGDKRAIELTLLLQSIGDDQARKEAAERDAAAQKNGGEEAEKDEASDKQVPEVPLLEKLMPSIVNMGPVER